MARTMKAFFIVPSPEGGVYELRDIPVLAERIAGAEFVLLEPAGHCFWLEQPEQSRAAISRFIHAHSVSESR